MSELKIKQIVSDSNAFVFDLLKTVCSDEEEKDNNIFISPLSVSSALAMLNNGAAGETSREIQQTLGFNNVSTGK